MVGATHWISTGVCSIDACHVILLLARFLLSSINRDVFTTGWEDLRFQQWPRNTASGSTVE